MAIRESYAVIATIIRDSSGVVLGARVRQIDAVDALEGEAEAARLGMELVRCQGFREVLLEGDSESRLHRWQASYVYRDANSLVHHLAR